MAKTAGRATGTIRNADFATRACAKSLQRKVRFSLRVNTNKIEKDKLWSSDEVERRGFTIDSMWLFATAVAAVQRYLRHVFIAEARSFRAGKQLAVYPSPVSE
jgi:hypothetical protein